ncbi:hypothetical protein D5086_010071 [Populus alba]|uniref:Uncharacterized protein n=3 Tax=Populus alba TaxID=43335 RepID=A0ACC4AQZ7_POPAL
MNEQPSEESTLNQTKENQSIPRGRIEGGRGTETKKEELSIQDYSSVKLAAPSIDGSPKEKEQGESIA